MRPRFSGVFLFVVQCDNGSMQSTKERLRMELLQRRKALSADEMRIASQAIVHQLPGAADWSRVKTVHVYRSLAQLGEIDTQSVIDWLRKTQPAVMITAGESSPVAPLPEREFDAIFVPVVGFDRDGFRLGMGGGWYDRWLATQPHAIKIGLSYAWAEVQNLPHEPHDIPLNLVIKG